MERYYKKVLAIFATFMLLLLTACGNGSTENSGGASESTENNGEISSNDVINAKIGVISYLTGAGAAYGESITQGLKLAQKEINEQGEVYIELVIEDSAGQAEQAVNAGQKLMADDSILAIIGPTL